MLFNCSNIDNIKADAEWDEDSYKWILPELSVLKTKLPPAGVLSKIKIMLYLYIIVNYKKLLGTLS